MFSDFFAHAFVDIRVGSSSTRVYALLLFKIKQSTLYEPPFFSFLFFFFLSSLERKVKIKKKKLPVRLSELRASGGREKKKKKRTTFCGREFLPYGHCRRHFQFLGRRLKRIKRKRRGKKM